MIPEFLSFLPPLFMEGLPAREGIKTPGESTGSLEAEVTGSCELPWVVAGTEFGSSARAVQLSHLSSLSCSYCCTAYLASLAGKLRGHSPVSTSYFTLEMPGLQLQVTVFRFFVVGSEPQSQLARPA